MQQKRYVWLVRDFGWGHLMTACLKVAGRHAQTVKVVHYNKRPHFGLALVRANTCSSVYARYMALMSTRRLGYVVQRE